MAARALPAGAGARQHGHEIEFVQPPRPTGDLVFQIQVFLGAHAPIQADGRAVLFIQQGFQDRLDRRDAGAGRHHDERAPVFFVIAEYAQRRFDRERRAGLRLPQPMVGIAAARNAPHMEIHLLASRCRRHGKAACLAIGQQHVHVLTRHEVQPGIRQRQRQMNDVFGNRFDALHGGRQAARFGKHLPAAGHADAQVAFGPRRAGQRIAFIRLFRRQRHWEFLIAQGA
ncbi:hypothetical protein G6F57_019399 [Rhizopus arrhizus]|nr:hypothetical protein G6F57_019399 [Rhizopus arrhizus]